MAQCVETDPSFENTSEDVSVLETSADKSYSSGLPPGKEDVSGSDAMPVQLEEEMDESTQMSANTRTRRGRKKRLFAMLLEQIEFYFSTASLTRDLYLQSFIEKDKFVPISVFLTFNKIRELTCDASDIARAVQKSLFLQLSPDGSGVGRRSPFVLKEDAEQCTIYVENIPRGSGASGLRRTFSMYGTIDYISIPVHRTTGQHRGFGFVEFRTPNMAHNALQAFGALGRRMSTGNYPEYENFVNKRERSVEPHRCPSADLFPAEDPNDPEIAWIYEQNTYTHYEPISPYDPIFERNCEIHRYEYMPTPQWETSMYSESDELLPEQSGERGEAPLGPATDEIEQGPQTERSASVCEADVDDAAEVTSPGRTLPVCDFERDYVTPEKSAPAQPPSARQVERDDVTPEVTSPTEHPPGCHVETETDDITPELVSPTRSPTYHAEASKATPEAMPSTEKALSGDIAHVMVSPGQPSIRAGVEHRPGKRKLSTDSTSRDMPLKVTRFAETPESSDQAASSLPTAGSATPAYTDTSNWSGSRPEGTSGAASLPADDTDASAEVYAGGADAGGGGGGTARRRRTRRGRRQPAADPTEDTQLLALQIMPLSEWCRFKKEYRAIQKENMGHIKAALRERRLNAQQLQVDPDSKVVGSREPEFVPFSVVRFTPSRPTGYSNKQVISELKLRYAAAYVELTSDPETAYMRFPTTEAAAAAVASEELVAARILYGSVELEYWRRLAEERRLTRSRRRRTTERGRDRLMRRIRADSESDDPLPTLATAAVSAENTAPEDISDTSVA